MKQTGIYRFPMINVDKSISLELLDGRKENTEERDGEAEKMGGGCIRQPFATKDEKEG